jgi:GTP-binding protein
MSAFPAASFLTSANGPRQFFPDTGAEVAFAGRSNAGKSSAINAIVQRNGLAKTSKTPGATRLVNFFELEPGRRLVDLPGYGYAAVPGTVREHWRHLLDAYFRGRRSLRGALVVMDVRHPLTPHDRAMLEVASTHGVPVHVLLTKADKLGRNAARQALAATKRQLADGSTIQLFSALTGEGCAEARSRMLALLAGARAKETPAGPADPTGAS